MHLFNSYSYIGICEIHIKGISTETPSVVNTIIHHPTNQPPGGHSTSYCKEYTQ